MRQLRAPKSIIGIGFVGLLSPGSLISLCGDEDPRVYMIGLIFGCKVGFPVLEDGSVIGQSELILSPDREVRIVNPTVLGLSELRLADPKELPNGHIIE